MTPDLTLDVGLPANVDAEKTILGAVLLDNSAFLEAAQVVKPDDFSLDSHRRIFLRMGELSEQGQAIDIITLAHCLGKYKEVEAIGGAAYLCYLTEGLPRRPVIEDYIRIVRDKAMLRRLMGVCSAAIARAADQSEEATQVVDDTQREIEEIGTLSGDSDSSIERLSVQAHDEFLNERKANDEKLQFGILDLDAQLGGLRAGEQTALGASSGVGKTTLLAQVLYANRHLPCHAFLLEPTRQQVLRKLWSIDSGVRYAALTDPRIATPQECDEIGKSVYRVAQFPLRMNDDANLTLDRVLAIARQSIHRYGTRLIAVDYIQRVKVRAAEKGEPVRLRVARASTALADLVKNTKCHSLLLSQLTTGRKNGAQAMPTMYDFRESSQIENDAHTIILLHRRFDEEQGHYADDGAILVPKVRFGTPCNLKARFDPRMAIWRGVTEPMQNQWHERD